MLSGQRARAPLKGSTQCQFAESLVPSQLSRRFACMHVYEVKFPNLYIEWPKALPAEQELVCVLGGQVDGLGRDLTELCLQSPVCYECRLSGTRTGAPVAKRAMVPVIHQTSCCQCNAQGVTIHLSSVEDTAGCAGRMAQRQGHGDSVLLQ